ncbi:hypothetical protein PSPO01_13493 [Paraphaeosphaeria sporulosa]
MAATGSTRPHTSPRRAALPPPAACAQCVAAARCHGALDRKQRVSVLPLPATLAICVVAPGAGGRPNRPRPIGRASVDDMRPAHCPLPLREPLPSSAAVPLPVHLREHAVAVPNNGYHGHCLTAAWLCAPRMCCRPGRGAAATFHLHSRKHLCDSLSSHACLPTVTLSLVHAPTLSSAYSRFPREQTHRLTSTTSGPTRATPPGNGETAALSGAMGSDALTMELHPPNAQGPVG